MVACVDKSSIQNSPAGPGWGQKERKGGSDTLDLPCPPHIMPAPPPPHPPSAPRIGTHARGRVLADQEGGGPRPPGTHHRPRPSGDPKVMRMQHLPGQAIKAGRYVVDEAPPASTPPRPAA